MKSRNQINYRRVVVQLLCACFLWMTGWSQDGLQPYYFDGNDVVFVFDIRNYASALESEDSAKVDFRDLEVYTVAVSGKFNNWSKRGWKMQRKGEFLFELRKHLKDFNESFPLEFRYVINGRYLTETEGVAADRGKYADDFLKDVYKLDLSVLKVSKEGNVVFSLKGHASAEQVILTGSFNNWDEKAIHMERTSDGWELWAELPPGRYEYKFIVDGTWMHDPANRDLVQNEHGTYNSVLYITKAVTFTLKGYLDARNVILAGSFNDWNEQKTRMIRMDNTWKVTVDLPGGKHHYKFIVDGMWMTDPANPIIENDGEGNLNSVLFVY